MGTCDHCGGEISDPETLSSHQKSCDLSDKKKIYECANCGYLFEDYPSRREGRGRETFYCSRECKNNHARNGEVVECSWCGDDTYKPSGELDEMGDYSLDNHFCDKECETAFKKSEWVGENHPSWDGGDDEIVCEECGDTFSVKPAKSDETRFCSVKCWSQSYYLTVECDNCGEEYERREHLVGKTEHNICSDGCYSEWWSDQQRGSSNPAYKTAGGKAGIAAVRRCIGDVAWDRRARQVRDRDNHTCQLCGDKPDDRVLDVHHIVPIASGGTNDPSNLMSLCQSCHKKSEAYTKQYVGQYLFAPADPDA